jgi:hypothetical protein
MDTDLWLITASLIFIIFFFLLISLYLGKILFSNKQLKNEDSNLEKSNLSPIAFCDNHLQAQAVSACAICNTNLCDSCLRSNGKLHFCEEHIRMFNNNSWKKIAEIVTTPDFPEEGTFLYSFKNRIWNSSQIPSYIVTNYQVDEKNNQIHSQVRLYVKQDESDFLKKEISKGFN